MIKRLTLSLTVAVSILGVIPMGASAQWKVDKYNNRTWVENGVKAKGWKLIKSDWYNFDSDGRMRTGWMKDGDNWYYFWSNGTMAKSAWLSNGGHWYYFDTTGKEVYDTIDIQNTKYEFTPTLITSSQVNSTTK